MKKFLSVLTVGTLAMGMAACATEETKEVKETKKVDQVLNLISGSEIPTLDLSKATDSVSFEVLGNTNEGLFRLGKDNTIIPGVALEATPNDTKTVWTFKLRQDSKWSNGDSVTAKDFVFSWQRTLNPDTASEYAYIMYDLKNAQKVNEGKAKPEELGVKAIDDYTLEVTLERPVTYFMELMAFPIFYPQHGVTASQETYGQEADKQVYNGPFEMTEWKHEESYTIEKNDDYWNKKEVTLEKVNFKIVKDTTTAVNLYESGDVHKVGLTAEYVDKYKDSKEFDSAIRPVMFFLRMNQDHPVLKDPKAREAIALAVDKKLFVDTLLGNGSIAANYFTPSGLAINADGVDYRTFASPEYSQLVLDKAKAKDIWTALGKEVTIEYLTYDDDVSKKVAEFMKEQLETTLPGLTIEIKQQPFKQKLELESKKEFQMSFSGWGADYPDPMTFLDMFVTDGPYNQMNYSNAEFDALIKKAKESGDAKERWDTMKQAEELFINDFAIVPMYQRGLSWVQKSNVEGIATHGFGPGATYMWTVIK